MYYTELRLASEIAAYLWRSVLLLVAVPTLCFSAMMAPVCSVVLKKTFQQWEWVEKKAHASNYLCFQMSSGRLTTPLFSAWTPIFNKGTCFRSFRAK